MRHVGICALTLLCLTSPFSLAEDKPDTAMEATQKMATGDAERCLGITRIRDMDVLDSRNILFRTRPDQVYLNTLPRSCGGLTRFKTISYKTSLHELCDVDIITVLNDVGGGYMPGASCGLGKFYPISNEDADRLYKASRE